MSEKMIRSLKSEKRDYRLVINDWVKESRVEQKPICITCANLDSRKNRLKTKEEYMKGMKQVRKNVSMIKENGSKNGTPVKYIMFDYQCPFGHGISMQYRADEYVEPPKKNTFGKVSK